MCSAPLHKFPVADVTRQLCKGCLHLHDRMRNGRPLSPDVRLERQNDAGVVGSVPLPRVLRVEEVAALPPFLERAEPRSELAWLSIR